MKSIADGGVPGNYYRKIDIARYEGISPETMNRYARQTKEKFVARADEMGITVKPVSAFWTAVPVLVRTVLHYGSVSYFLECLNEDRPTSMIPSVYWWIIAPTERMAKQNWNELKRYFSRDLIEEVSNSGM